MGGGGVWGQRGGMRASELVPVVCYCSSGLPYIREFI